MPPPALNASKGPNSHTFCCRSAPDWWTRGVPRLEMEDHVKQRLEQHKKAKPATVPTKPTVEDR